MTILLPQHQSLLAKSVSPSLYTEEADYQILILRYVQLDDDGLSEYSISTVFADNEITEINHQTGDETKLSSELEFWTRQRHRSDQEIELLSNYLSEIDDLEDMIYERRLPRYYLGLSFRLKRDLAKLERVLSRRLLIIKEMHLSRKNPQARSVFQEMNYKLDSHSKSAAHQIQRLDNMQRYFESLKQERMNVNIYLLAIVSTIFLPLNLIVGFFGINTENLYFSGNPNATNYVVIILAVTFFIFIFALPAIRLIDQLILGRIFGRLKFYSKLSSKIEKMAKRLEV